MNLHQTIRKFTPHSVINAYHRTLSVTGAAWYGHPSRKMTVIGVTGTTGKSTVCDMLATIFMVADKKVGVSSTIRFRVGEETWLNNDKQTMPGRWKLQALLKRMVDAGCTIAILETTSQGLEQNRHIGVDYDAAVWTNLTPEHIESHGSFAAYRDAKGKLFASLMPSYHKAGIPKVSVINLDSPEAQYFVQYAAEKKVGYRTTASPLAMNVEKIIAAEHIQLTKAGSAFTINGMELHLPLPGEYNVQNALAAISVTQAYGVALETIRDALATVQGVPGRFETIPTNKPYSVIVDYAHEPAGLEAVYKAARASNPSKLIAVLGSAGGGRDKGKRPTLGQLAAQYADIAIFTNEDPYDEDPMRIINEVADGAASNGKKDGEDLFRILDRRDGIQKALSLAQAGDMVLITGKGSEQSMMVAGYKKIPWSDRKTVLELTSTQTA